MSKSNHLIDQALREARAGKRLVYIVERTRDVGPILDRIAAAMTRDRSDSERLVCARGCEEYRHPSGGLITFRSTDSTGLRGISADRVVVDEAVLDPEQLVEVIALMENA